MNATPIYVKMRKDIVATTICIQRSPKQTGTSSVLNDHMKTYASGVWIVNIPERALRLGAGVSPSVPYEAIPSFVDRSEIYKMPGMSGVTVHLSEFVDQSVNITFDYTARRLRLVHKLRQRPDMPTDLILEIMDAALSRWQKSDMDKISSALKTEISTCFKQYAENVVMYIEWV